MVPKRIDYQIYLAGPGDLPKALGTLRPQAAPDDPLAYDPARA
jgi:hypothetical protein